MKPAAASAALALHDVHLNFGQTQVLRGVSLTLGVGERLALIGPNGAGKSSLFDVISGHRPPSAGAVWLQGQRLQGLSELEVSRRGLARSFQTSRLFVGLSVEENLSLGVRGQLPSRYRLWSGAAQRAQVQARVQALLTQLGLSAQREVLVANLTYADQRSLEIGLAVAGDAPVVLLDEPTAGMSQAQTRHMVALIRRLTEGRSLLMVEHDMDVVFGLADRVAVLVQGRILACDVPEAIRAHAPVQAAYLGAGLSAIGA